MNDSRIRAFIKKPRSKRGRKKIRVKAKSIPITNLSKRKFYNLKKKNKREQTVIMERPKCRQMCTNFFRPCPFVGCKYHLYLDVNPETGTIKLNYPNKEVWELDETCALDVAERGGLTLDEIGQILNLTRERIRQLELLSLQKLHKQVERDNFIEFLYQ